jgi:hypothetical protein
VGQERFNLTYIDDRFADWLRTNYGPDVSPGFNATYVRALYRYAYMKAASGRAWTHEVPLPKAMPLTRSAAAGDARQK